MGAYTKSRKIKKTNKHQSKKNAALFLAGKAIYIYILTPYYIYGVNIS